MGAVLNLQKKCLTDQWRGNFDSSFYLGSLDAGIRKDFFFITENLHVRKLTTIYSRPWTI